MGYNYNVLTQERGWKIKGGVMKMKLNTWGVWWGIFFIILAVFITTWVVKSQNEEAAFRVWANAQWAKQPTYEVLICGRSDDCKKEENFYLTKFFYFPKSEICKSQTREGDCSANFLYKDGEFEKMHEFFRASGWVQPERFPPWWRLPYP